MLAQSLLDELHPAQRVPRWISALQQATWPSRGTLVAEDDVGHVIGFADLRPTRDDDAPSETGEIVAFYVLPTDWRRGVGSRLIAAAEQSLRAAGFTAATLWVLEANAPAIRFYVRSGWQPDGAVKDAVFAGSTVRERRYRRELR